MKVLVSVLLLAVACAKHEKYQGWKSLYVRPNSMEQMQIFGKFVDAYHVDVLSHPIHERAGVVVVSPIHEAEFLKVLDEHNIGYKVHAADVKVALDLDDLHIQVQKNTTRARNSRELPYDNYQELETIDAYLDDIAVRYPNLVTLVSPANSFEGRPIKYLKISTTNFQQTSKPVILIDGGIHAREWISPPTVTWAIKTLVEDLTEPDLLERFDWILFPIVNPDGYNFSFTDTRSNNTHFLSDTCPGVDGNRNYDFFWDTVGTSPNPCSETWAGNQAFSEIETRVVRDIMNEHLARMALYITIHSYSSMILYSWGHDGSLSNNSQALHTVGVAMAEAIEAKSISDFPRYIVGNSALTIGYAAAGASDDYAHSIGVPLSYTYELPGLSEGLDGFHLDPIYIEQVCMETWDGIVAGARKAGDLFVPPP